MESLEKVFTGKGGTTRLIATGLILLGIFALVTENDYKIDGTYKKVNLFSLKPARAEVQDEKDENKMTPFEDKIFMEEITEE